MKRVYGNSSLLPRNSRIRCLREIPELPLEMWSNIFSFLDAPGEGEEEEEWMSKISVVSKNFRELIFKSETTVEISKTRTGGVFSDNCACLGRSTLYLLPKFSNATSLRLFWAPTNDVFKEHVSELSNLSSLLVCTDADIFPSSIAFPEKLTDLTVYKEAHPSWRSFSATVDGIWRFVNLARLKIDGKDRRLWYPRSCAPERTCAPVPQRADGDDTPGPCLPKLSFLELVNTYSPAILNHPSLRLDGLTKLAVLESCAIDEARLDNLTSLTELVVRQLGIGGPSRTSLNELTGLKTLRLQNWNVPLDAVSRLSNLTHLHLDGENYCGFFDRLDCESGKAGLQRELKKLSLQSTGDVDVSKLTNLTSLQIRGLSTCDARAVANLPLLESLTLEQDGHGLDDDNVGTLEKLRSLKLYYTKETTSKSVSRLTNLTKLKTAYADGINQDIALKLTNLKSLEIYALGKRQLCCL